MPKICQCFGVKVCDIDHCAATSNIKSETRQVLLLDGGAEMDVDQETCEKRQRKRKRAPKGSGLSERRG